jgi:subtilisin family serine protease
MLKKLLVFALLCYSTSLLAQSSKISLSLQRKMEQAIRTVNYDISIFVKGNPDEVKAKTLAAGGYFKYAVTDICAIRIPINKVNDIAAINSVSRIEDNNLHLQPLNDKAIINNHADLVHQGLGLPQGYDGEGVVVAVIDVGLDPTHPDFRNPDGSTRLKYFWNQTAFTSDSALRPQPFNYGIQYIGSQVDTVSPNPSTLDDAYSHGTHVTGSACGNGLALNNYKGMAPKADIVFIKLAGSDETNGSSSLADAVVYAFACGDILNKPVVINLSIGDYIGSHDGRDLQTQTIDALLGLKNGRVVVAAAGNAGEAKYHLGYDITSDTLFTWLQTSGHPINFEAWSDTGHFENAQFAIAIDRILPNYQYLASGGFHNISPYINTIINDTLYSGTNRLGIISTSAAIVNGAYQLDIAIRPDSVASSNNLIGYNWRIMTKGSGRLDAWSFDMVSDGLPSASQFPIITKYKKPDLNETTVSSFQCSDRVITVGSYDNRDSYTNAIHTQTSDTAVHVGNLSPFSSHGPTRDGRTKPDITAPGGWVLSCGGQANLAWLFANDPAREAAGAEHFRSSGTSMASPMVAGICALYLQRYPTAWYYEVKNALTNCSTHDSFTGNALPDNLWGYGKANAYNMVRGCTVGIDEVSPFNATISIYPNPFADHATVDYDLTESKYNKAELKITDMMGKEIRSIALTAKRNSFPLLRSNLPAGVYFYTLMLDGKVAKTNKLVIF